VAALGLMLLVPALEILARPVLGGLVVNASLLTQHLGLMLSMGGAVAAYPAGHLSSLTGATQAQAGGKWARLPQAHRLISLLLASLCAAVLAGASFELVLSERAAPRPLAYGVELWMVQAAMPFGFAALAWLMASDAIERVLRYRTSQAPALRQLAPLLGLLLVAGASSTVFTEAIAEASDLRWVVALAVLMALGGAPIFAVIGILALGLFAASEQPLASIPLSQYAITVNPSLPALPLYTLAGLLFARTSAAQRLGMLISRLFGEGLPGTVLAAALLCSAFTALTGASGVTILALGGILLPMLLAKGYPGDRGIGLLTSASALGVLLAPSVPLIMYAILARVPINVMLAAGLFPALLMVASLLLLGGFTRRSGSMQGVVQGTEVGARAPQERLGLVFLLWRSAWELCAPLVALLPLLSGWATPTESAALTALYAALVACVVRRELGLRELAASMLLTAQLIGGIMLILGMALGLTNYLIDAGIPDLAIDAVQSVISDRVVFIFALVAFIALAGALMEIYAALVVLVPLLLPLASSYGIHPVHFGILFLATLEMGFLCPPAGMNLYFSSAVFGKPLRLVIVSVLPALAAIFAGSLLLALVPEFSLWLPQQLGLLTKFPAQ
jgi:tripartite ATP-independent transporter DctM subunit